MIFCWTLQGLITSTPMPADLAKRLTEAVHKIYSTLSHMREAALYGSLHDSSSSMTHGSLLNKDAGFNLSDYAEPGAAELIEMALGSSMTHGSGPNEQPMVWVGHGFMPPTACALRGMATVSNITPGEASEMEQPAATEGSTVAGKSTGDFRPWLWTVPQPVSERYEDLLQLMGVTPR